MKKLAFTLMACVACMQSAQAIESPLNQSISIDTQILQSTQVQEVLDQNGFIIELKRLTQNLDEFGEVFYQIVTKQPTAAEELVIDADLAMDIDDELSELSACNHSRCHKHHHHRAFKYTTYNVRLLVAPNELIGPPVVTILSIRKVRNHWESRFDNSNQSSS